MLSCPCLHYRAELKQKYGSARAEVLMKLNEQSAIYLLENITLNGDLMTLSEKEKMIAGAKYNAGDAELLRARMRAHDLCHALSQVKPSDLKAKADILQQLLPYAGEGLFITPAFFCDYGWNITTGKDFYCNTGCVILDCAPVHIGDSVLLAPGVHIYTATHSLEPNERADAVEWAEPVHIGNKVWIGGHATVCPGVNIGDGVVIGAGSVVTKNIPANVIAAGNPCRVIRKNG